MGGKKIVIRAKHIKKSYRQYKTNWQKIKFLLLMREAGKKTDVLEDVSFDIRKGEKVGIIGGQQSGKSTLMRVLAGVIRPDSGKVQINGEISSILDLRVGFDNNMSGLDNYLLMSTALGRSEQEIKDFEEEVFEFTRLKREKNEPIRTYKKGAATRLGFAIATAKKGDIILYDAGLSFGSKPWNDACLERLKELVSGDTTLVMTVNWANVAAQLCDRGIVVHEGRVVFDGAFQDAVTYFKKNCRRVTQRHEEIEQKDLQLPEDTTKSEDNSSDDSSSDDNSSDDNGYM